MEAFTSIQIEHQGSMSTITLDRADKHNAISTELIRELKQAFQQCQTADTRSILLKANGKHFCAGADLNWMRASKNHSAERNKEETLALAHLLQAISNSRKPVITVVHGRTMGGGCGLIAASDIAIACEDASFCFSEVRLGLIPATIAPYVVRRIGYQAARVSFLTAELLSSQQAKQRQLIDHVVTDTQQAMSLATTIANQLVTNSPNAMWNVKVLLNHLKQIDDKLIDFTATMLANVRTTEEAQQGLNAFFEKRQPEWCKDDH